MAATHLKCRECRRRVRARGAVRLRPLLRAARGRLRPRRPGAPTPHQLRRRIQAGPAEHLALRGLPAARAAARPVRPRVLARRPARRLHAADPRRPARRAPRPARGVGQERRREPDALVQGPRRLRRRRTRARELGFDVARLRLDRQPRQRGRRPRRRARHASPTSSSRPTSRSRRSSRPASTARTSSRSSGNYDDVNRLCTELSGERELGVRQRQHAPVLRRGLEDARLRDRRAARLADARPRRRADRLGLAVHEDRQGLRGVARARASSTGDVPTMNGAQAEGCSPVASAFAAGHDVCRPVKPDTIAKSLAIGNPADGPYALELARRTGGGIDAVTDDEIRAGHPPARRDDRHLHRDRRRHDDRDARQARRARRHRRRASASCSSSPARASRRSTRCAARSSPTRSSRPTTSSSSTVEGAGVRA